MTESHGGGLLAAFEGRLPPAPAWFGQAMAMTPQRRHHEVAGARIESLSWGERGRPGLLLMHGNGAHAQWWSFIAPFFARDWRVAAFSWSGMGDSGWRDAYTLDLFVQEMFEVAQAEGLFDAAVPPVFVGHSFGGFPTMAGARRHGERLRAVVVVDSPIRTPEQRRQFQRAREQRELRPMRVYPSLDEALMRFRLMPVQPCEHPYIVDHIARASLREAAAGEASPGGWTWRFDPFMWRDYRMGSPTEDLAGARCPIAMIWGARSSLVRPEMIDYVKTLMPEGSPMIEIPDADHHVMLDQPLAFVAALRALLAAWPAPHPSAEKTGETP
jgi:pimeloyl-ACP methyl ester carboxylesterase